MNEEAPRKPLKRMRVSPSTMTRFVVASHVDRWLKLYVDPHPSEAMDSEDAWAAYLDWLKRQLKSVQRADPIKHKSPLKRGAEEERRRIAIASLERAMNRQLFEQVMTDRCGELQGGAYQHLLLRATESKHRERVEGQIQRSSKWAAGKK